MNKTLLSGAVLGLLSVLMAAYVDHALAPKLVGKSVHSMEVAVKYHQLYSLLITIIGLILPFSVNQKTKLWLRRSASIFLIGILLFSFSIYISVIFDQTEILRLAPIGGILLMIGWIFLMRIAWLKNK